MTAGLNQKSLAESEAIHSMGEFAQAGFGPKSNWALAASLSPNPKNPPYYFDLPTKNG